MRRPRWVHCLYAWAFGYFWMPCPVCGRMFGGHECRRWDDDRPSGVNVVTAPGVQQAICPECTEAGRGEQPTVRWPGER